MTSVAVAPVLARRPFVPALFSAPAFQLDKSAKVSNGCGCAQATPGCAISKPNTMQLLTIRFMVDSAFKILWVVACFTAAARSWCLRAGWLQWRERLKSGRDCGFFR